MLTLNIYDSNFNRVADISNYEFFSWIRRFRNVDEFQLHINRYNANVEFLIEGNWIIAFIGGENRAARIEKENIGLTESGKTSETLKLKGYSGSQPLRNRVIFEDTLSGDGYDTQTSVIAETAMKHYVDQNIVNPTDTNRDIPNFIISPDLSRGNTINVRARFQKMNELLNGICLSGDIGYETTFNLTTQNNEFDAIEGTDKTASVNISTDTGNIQNINFEKSVLDTLSIAYVGGQGTAAARNVREVFTAVSEPSGYDRKEVFIDARDLSSNDELDDRGTAVLKDNEDKLLMDFTYLDTGMFQYLNDFNLGDIITITYVGIATLQARIIRISESYLPQRGKVINIGIGKEFPDIFKLIKDNLMNLEPNIRE